MGATDVVPGVSGGTVALVLGIYQRLINAIRDSAKALVPLTKANLSECLARLRSLDYVFLLPLGVGIAIAVAALAGPIETQLHDNPEEMAGIFFGLVAASILIASRLIKVPQPAHYLMMGTVGAVLFVLLGFQSGPISNPVPLVLLGSGALAACAMILPGISGSFVLLMIGMYNAVIGAISTRDITAMLYVVAGAGIGLILFSSMLGWIMDRHKDLVTAAMIGLMIGSLRVLWPWPNGVGVISDTQEEVVNGAELAWPASTELPVPLVLAILAALVVLGLAKLSERLAARQSQPQATKGV